MKNKVFLFNFFWILAGVFAMNTKAAVAGPHQSLDPANGNYKVGQSFTVTAKMDSGGQVIGGADGVGTYDADILELVSVEKAPSMVFSNTDDGGNCSISEFELGKFSYACYSNSNTSSNSDSGDLVVFTFKGKAVGTGKVVFTCVQDSTTDTNIIKTDPVSDIIVCSENINGTYVISEGTEETSTPTPTSTSSSSEDTTEELPQTGVIGGTLGLILFGAISVVSAIFLKFL